MSVSKLLPTSGNNDFNIAITGPDTVVVFDKEYAAGSYTITISGGDTSFDMYAYNAAGTTVGYTNSPSFSASAPFNKIVIVGQTAGVLFSFTYKKTYTSTATSTEVLAGPVVTSVSPSSLPNLNSTLTVTGKNFASNCTVTFTSANTAYPATAAKAVVRNSETSLTVTRPDNLLIAYSPYTLTVQNPGVTNPTGSNSHMLVNGVTAGSVPVWNTGVSLPLFTKNVAYSATVSATDPDGGTITYSIVTNALPAGLSFNTATGVISGTPTGSTNGTITIRATDSGNNYTDRTFNVSNVAPTWTTAAGAITAGAQGLSYTFTFVATDDSGTAPTYSVTAGTVPAGLSLNGTTGALTGTPTTPGTSSFTVTATDANGGTTDRAFTQYIASAIVQSFTTTGTSSWTYPASAVQSLGVQVLVVAAGGGGGDGGAAGGGGGAGSYIEGTLTLTPGSAYSYTVGAGMAPRGANPNTKGDTGGNSAFGGVITANGGGGGGGNGQSAGSGGSGGGGSNTSTAGAAAGSAGTVPAGCTGYTNAGGNHSGAGYSWGIGGQGGGAGGAGAVGSTSGNANGRTSTITGTSYEYARGGRGGFGNNGNESGDNNTAYGWGGGGINDGSGGGSGNGIVVLKYYA